MKFGFLISLTNIHSEIVKPLLLSFYSTPPPFIPLPPPVILSKAKQSLSYQPHPPLSSFPWEGSCLKCHSEERSDEESVGGAGSAQIVPTTPRPFATLRVTWMQSCWGKAPGRGRGKKKKEGLPPLLDVLLLGVVEVI